MPRYPRVFLTGFPLHIVQRGHDRQPVFLNEADYRFYLRNLEDVKNERQVDVLAYCLMANHVHLVLVPRADGAEISKLMRVLAARQTRRVNRMENRSGTLWEGRFNASLIDTDEYLLACCRYVDLNPVRAVICSDPSDYPWSGYAGRSGIRVDSLLDDHTIFSILGSSPDRRATAYRDFVSLGISDNELKFIRQTVRRNQLTGNQRFKKRVEARIDRRLSSRGPGRPRKGE